MTFEREEAERFFLASVLEDNGILAETHLDIGMFKKYRGVFAKILDLSKKGPVDTNALIVHRGDLEPVMIADVMETCISAQWTHFQRAIYEGWAEDHVHKACKQAVELPYSSAVETIEQALTAVTLRETGSTTKRLGDLLGPALERIGERMKLRGKLPGISFGLESVDRATMGAQGGRLVVIGARPSQGKSALMAQIARRMASAEKVGIITVESDENELTQRLLTAESQIDGRKLSTGILSAIDMAKLAEAGHRLNAIRENMAVHDQPGIKLSQMQSVARRMAREGAKVIFLDYLQLVRVPGKESRREEVAEVSTSIKALARELGVCIVALAQLSRDSDDKRPTMGDCQHSSQIEQDADQVWLIWHRKDREGKVYESRLILDKVRDGMTRDVLIRFDRPTLSFYEIDTKEAS